MSMWTALRQWLLSSLPEAGEDKHINCFIACMHVGASACLMRDACQARSLSGPPTQQAVTAAALHTRRAFAVCGCVTPLRFLLSSVTTHANILQLLQCTAPCGACAPAAYTLSLHVHGSHSIHSRDPTYVLAALGPLEWQQCVHGVGRQCWSLGVARNTTLTGLLLSGGQVCFVTQSMCTVPSGIRANKHSRDEQIIPEPACTALASRPSVCAKLTEPWCVELCSQKHHFTLQHCPELHNAACISQHAVQNHAAAT